MNGLEVNIKPLLSPLYHNNYDFDSLASIVSVRSGMLELAKHQRKDMKLRPIITSFRSAIHCWAWSVHFGIDNMYSIQSLLCIL